MSQMYRKSQPTLSDVHIDRPLTNISIAFMQDVRGYVADQVFPNIPVQSASDKYFTIPRGMFYRDEMQKRAPGAESQGVGYNVSTDNYNADVWALHKNIPDQVRANSDSPLQPDREATELLMQMALTKREVLWVANFFAASIWSTEETGVDAAPAANQFLRWNVSGSLPLKDIARLKAKVAKLTGYEPNVLVLGREVWEILQNHADLVERIKFSGGVSPAQPAVVGLEALAQLVEVEKVVVARAVRNTAVEGAADAFSFVAGKHALLAYVPPNPGIMVPAAGYTFSWTGLLGAGPGGQRISRFRMEHLKSDRVEIEMAFSQKKVSADLAAFFITAVA